MLEGTAIDPGQREVRLLVVFACECFDYLQGTGSGISTLDIASWPGQWRRLIRGCCECCPDGVDIPCRVHYLAARKEG